MTRARWCSKQRSTGNTGNALCVGIGNRPVQNINGFDYEVVEEPFYVFDTNGMNANSQLGRVRVDAL